MPFEATLSLPHVSLTCATLRTDGKYRATKRMKSEQIRMTFLQNPDPEPLPSPSPNPNLNYFHPNLYLDNFSFIMMYL